MKKIILAFTLAFTILTGVSGIKTADARVKNSQEIFLNNKGEAGFYQTDLQDFFPNPQGKLNVGGAYTRTLVEIVRGYIYKFLIPITIILSAYGGIQLIFSRGKEDTFKEKKQQILSYFYGFATLLLAIVMVDGIFFGREGELLMQSKNPAEDIARVSKFAEKGYTEFQGIFRYIITFAAVVAVAFVIYSAVRLMTANANVDAEQKKFKVGLQYTAIGMAILVSTQKVMDLFTGNKAPISQIWTRDDHMLRVPEVSGAVDFITDWINFLLGTIGFVSVIALVYAGIQLITNIGADASAKEKATKILRGAITGLIVVFSSWTIMYFFLNPKGTSDIEYVRPRERCADPNNPDCKLKDDGSLNEERSEKTKRENNIRRY